MKEEIYDIVGMHCAACSSAVERVTRKLPGVKESNVNLPLNRLTIVYDENETSSEDIINKIKKAGFSASLKNEEKKEEKEDASKELKKEKISLIFSCVFAFLLLTISMGQMLFPNLPMPDIISLNTHPVNFALVQMLLTIPVLILGKKFFISGFSSLIHLTPNMDALVALSSSASFIFSVITTFLISDNHHAVHNLYFESAAVVVSLVSVGKYMEEKNKQKTKSSISALMALTPDTAILVDKNGEWEVPTQMIKKGDTVLVKHGAKIPLDGIVTSGSGSADEAMLTGESNPVEKEVGSEVIGGSISTGGAMYIEVTRVGEDTTLAKIIKFVEDAQNKKAPIARIADKVAGIFVPALIAIAVISGIVWYIVNHDFSFALKIFTSVLVIGCPCAMGLATPTAIIVGTGLGATKGILIRNAEALETTHKADVVIFDKTGTLTEGKMSVTDIISENEDELLSIAYSLEKLSQHPISSAICDEAEKRNTKAIKINAFESKAGFGIEAIDEESRKIFVGNKRLLIENGVSENELKGVVDNLQESGKTPVFVARENKLLGIIAVSDTVKIDAESAIAKLKKLGIKTVMLTGDNKKAAEFIGGKLGFDEIVSEVLPTEKASVVKKYQQSNKTVIMVGDGINDAPALTEADIGCAMGNGSDAAIESAEIVLMNSSLNNVANAIRLSRLTIRNIKQNLFWAFCYNCLAIPIAAGVLYPAFGLLLSPMIGALAMSLSSLFVVTNALRLKTYKI